MRIFVIYPAPKTYIRYGYQIAPTSACMQRSGNSKSRQGTLDSTWVHVHVVSATFQVGCSQRLHEAIRRKIRESLPYLGGLCNPAKCKILVTRRGGTRNRFYTYTSGHHGTASQVLH